MQGAAADLGHRQLALQSGARERPWAFLLRDDSNQSSYGYIKPVFHCGRTMIDSKSERNVSGAAVEGDEASANSGCVCAGFAPSPIRFTRAICGDLGQAERREWWIANGRAGYAAGTIAGSLTRRYHGLLIAPIASPLGRRLLLAKADATLIDGA